MLNFYKSKYRHFIRVNTDRSARKCNFGHLYQPKPEIIVHISIHWAYQEHKCLNGPQKLWTVIGDCMYISEGTVESELHFAPFAHELHTKGTSGRLVAPEVQSHVHYRLLCF